MPHISYTKHPTTAVIHKTHCCGIMEIDSLGKSPTPLDALTAIAKDLVKGAGHESYPGTGQYSPRFVTFSGVVGTREYRGSHDGGRTDDYGQAFVDFLTIHNLGTIISPSARPNWTGNTIKIWLWSPNYENLKLFFVANAIDYLYKPLKKEEPSDD